MKKIIRICTNFLEMLINIKYTYVFVYLFEESLVAIVFLLHYRTFQNKCRNYFTNSHMKDIL